jgi:multidrug resistance efflux pump
VQNSTNPPKAANKPSIFKNPILRNVGIVVVAIAIAGGFLYWRTSATKVSIDNSTISAPQISLSPDTAGELKTVYVNEGDEVPANTVVAQVGNELLKTQIAGIITSVNSQIGTTFNPGTAVVTMVDPTQLRVVGQLDENKGLDRIQVGQAATFTVDAFSGKTYQGVVDEVSPTANSNSVLFNISNERQTQIFDVKVRYDASEYPELKNGMSAKITVITK